MTSDNYARAYKEVIEIIKQFPQEEYNKIPKEKIQFYKDNMDMNYEFTINPEMDLSKQNISKEANAIIVTLFQDYFATEEQKRKINEILELNEIKLEKGREAKYSPDNLFNDKQEKTTDISEDMHKDIAENALAEHKENFFVRFKNFILNLFN